MIASNNYCRRDSLFFLIFLSYLCMNNIDTLHYGNRKDTSKINLYEKNYMTTTLFVEYCHRMGCRFFSIK